MSTLHFITPTILDEAFIFTMGASVKTSSNPIGFFGTGLKYAIAITLRLKGKIWIRTPHYKYTFFTKTETLRGQPIEMIYCDREELTSQSSNKSDTIRCPMTVDYGKTWEAWMALRELYSNTKDENGTVEEDSCVFNANDEYTVITVQCADIYDAWLVRDQYFINEKRKPFFTSDNLDVYLGRSSSYFYKGVRVSTKNYDLGMTYNIKTLPHTALSEDRSVPSYYLDSVVRYSFITAKKCEFTEMFSARLCIPDSYEHQDIGAGSLTPTMFDDIEVLKSLSLLYRQYPDRLPESWVNLIQAYLARENVEDLYPVAVLNDECQDRLDECLNFLTDKGFRFDGIKIHLTTTMPNRQHGSAMLQQRRMILNINETLLHDNWHAETCKTLIEEYIHITHHVFDETRAMQEQYNNYIYSILKTAQIP